MFDKQQFNRKLNFNIETIENKNGYISLSRKWNKVFMIYKYRKILKNPISNTDINKFVKTKLRAHKAKIKEIKHSYQNKFGCVILKRGCRNINNKSMKKMKNKNLHLQNFNYSFLSEFSENNTFNSMVKEVNDKYKITGTTNNNNFDQENVKNENNPEKLSINKDDAKKQIFEEMRRKEEKRLEKRGIEDEETRMMEIERLEERKRINETNDKYTEHKQKELMNSKICMEAIIQLNQQLEAEARAKRNAQLSRIKQNVPSKKYLMPATKPTYKSRLKKEDKKETKPAQTTPKTENIKRDVPNRPKSPIKDANNTEKKPVDKKQSNQAPKSKFASGDKSKPEPKLIKSQPIKKHESKRPIVAKPLKTLDNNKNKLPNKSKTGKPAPGKTSNTRPANGKNSVKNNKSKLSNLKNSDLQNRDVSSKEQDISNTETIEVEKVRNESSVKRNSLQPKKKGCCGKSDVKPSIETELVMVDHISNDKVDDGDGVIKGSHIDEPDRRSIKPV